MLPFLYGSKSSNEIIFRQNGKMAVFFASDSCISRFIFNERNLAKVVCILKNIYLCVFDLNPVLAVRLYNIK